MTGESPKYNALAALRQNGMPYDVPEIVSRLRREHGRCRAWLEGSCKFTPGEIVTPLPGYDYDYAGLPCVVMIVRDEQGEPIDGIGLSDMRIGFVHPNTYGFNELWVESWQFGPFIDADESKRN